MKYLVTLGHVEVLLYFSLLSRQNGKKLVYHSRSLQRRPDGKERRRLERLLTVCPRVQKGPLFVLTWSLAFLITGCRNLGPACSSPVLGPATDRPHLSAVKMLCVSSSSCNGVCSCLALSQSLGEWDWGRVQEPAWRGKGRAGTAASLEPRDSSFGTRHLQLCLEDLFSLKWLSVCAELSCFSRNCKHG